MAILKEFKTNLHITKELLEEEWIKNRLSQNKIAKKYEVPLSIIESRIKAYGLIGLANASHYFLDESKITLEDPIFCYYLGLIVTDGHVNPEKKYVTLALNNEGAEAVLNSIMHYLKYNGSVKVWYLNRKNPSYALTIFSETLTKFLTNLGIERVKTYNVPYILINKLTNKFLFWRGISDGDGSIRCIVGVTTSRLHFRITMASTLFMEDFVKDINMTLNLTQLLQKHNRDSVFYPKIEMNKYNSRVFLDAIYSEEYESFKLPKKYKNYLLIKDGDIVHAR